MKFRNRKTQFPGKQRLIKVDENNVPIPGTDPILIRLEKDEGTVIEEGTVIDAEKLNKGNWRDDESVSFMMRSDQGLPEPRTNETQIVTRSDGETWIVPPMGLGNAKVITDPIGSVVKVNGVKSDIEFTSDPQTQINNKVDKVTKPYQTYIVDERGATTTRKYSVDAEPSTFVYRNTQGNIYLPNQTIYPPITDLAVSRRYVEGVNSNSVPLVTSIQDTFLTLTTPRMHSYHITKSNLLSSFPDLADPFPGMSSTGDVYLDMYRLSTSFGVITATPVTSLNLLPAQISYFNATWTKWHRMVNVDPSDRMTNPIFAPSITSIPDALSSQPNASVGFYTISLANVLTSLPNSGNPFPGAYTGYTCVATVKKPAFDNYASVDLTLCGVNGVTTGPFASIALGAGVWGQWSTSSTKLYNHHIILECNNSGHSLISCSFSNSSSVAITSVTELSGELVRRGMNSDIRLLPVSGLISNATTYGPAIVAVGIFGNGNTITSRAGNGTTVPLTITRVYDTVVEI